MKRVLVRVVKVGLAVALVVTIVLFAIWPRPPKAPARVTSAAELETYLDTIVRFGRPPGLSLAVVKNGAVVYSRGFGLADGPRQAPATAGTVYRWWSMTKVPTAVAVLQLQEQGLVSLDDPVSKHLAFFQVNPKMTIRHLLNHSSGLPNLGLGLVRLLHREGDPPVNQTALVERILPEYSKLQFEPGTQTAYTNFGYMVLGAVIEKVAHQSYEDYVREHILRPLRMEHSDFVYTDAMRPDVAAGSHPVLDAATPLLPLFVKHWWSFQREIDEGHIWFNAIYTDYTPSTGIIGTAPDTARFMLAYLGGGELDGQRLLAPSSVATMSTADRISSPSRPGVQQGLGWVVGCGSRECLQHTGGGPGFGTAMRLYPRENLGLVVLTNDTTSNTGAILDLAASLEWPEIPRAEARGTRR
jgi:D-alanyl-D-alanine carboxypeptidase